MGCSSLHCRNSFHIHYYPSIPRQQDNYGLQIACFIAKCDTLQMQYVFLFFTPGPQNDNSTLSLHTLPTSHFNSRFQFNVESREVECFLEGRVWGWRGGAKAAMYVCS
jgi:hypothetical protein